MHLQDYLTHSLGKQKQKTNRCRTRNYLRSLGRTSTEPIMNTKNTKKQLEIR